jgi:two-component system, OmpR family, sensor histidine kinase KdpD
MVDADGVFGKSAWSMRISEISGDRPQRTRRQFLAESLAGCWAVGMLSFAGYILHFNSGTVGFLFLLIVVSQAILSGFWQATIVSVTACFCLDYFFYPPLLRLNIADPQDWVALGAFEIGALVVSRMSTREQRSFREATIQRTAMEQLYELSRSTLLINLRMAPGPQLAELIQRIFPVEGVAIYDGNSGQCDRAGRWGEDELDLAKQCFLVQADSHDSLSHTSLRVLRVGNECVGAMAIRGDLGTLVTNALASLAAITLDRCASFEKESRIEAAHQGERLRTAVLDSLAHAVKTPLTAIQTASSGLREVGRLNEAQDKLVFLVEDEVNQLNLLCNRLLQTARLEDGELSLGQDEIPVADLVSRVVKELSVRMAGHPIEVAVAEKDLTIRGDDELLSMALAQFLDNAAKYSFAGRAVKVAAWESQSEVMISVHNDGPAIPISDRERIFQRFYRSEGSKDMAAGTGIGLSTVKMAAEAHHGHVWVISNAEEGTTFFLALPQQRRRQQ